MESIAKIYKNSRLLIFSPFISGTILALALLNENLSFFAFIGLVPFFIFLHNTESKIFIFLGGWSYGITFFSILLLWLFDLLPLGWTGLSFNNALIFITFSWLLSSVALGFIFGLTSLAIRPFLSSRYYILSPVAWTMAEYAASWLPTVLWKGPASAVYPVTFGSLGYALVNFPNLAALSSIGSVYILSAIVFLVNIFFFVLIYLPRGTLHSLNQQPQLYKQKGILKPDTQRYLAHFAFGLIVILGIIIFNSFSRNENRTQPPVTRIAVVSSNVPSIFENSGEKPHITKALDSILVKLADENVDVIIFPESSRVVSQISTPRLRQLFYDTDTILVDNSYATDSTSLVSVLVAQRLKDGKELVSWGKRFLMMGGEYPPYTLTLWAKVFGFQDQLKQYTKTLYVPGKLEERPIPVKKRLLGASLCTGIWIPKFFAKQKQMGADILINMSSDILFHNSYVYLAQRLRALKLNAIENNNYLIHVANGSPSLLINPDGKVVETIEHPKDTFYAYKIITL